MASLLSPLLDHQALKVFHKIAGSMSPDDKAVEKAFADQAYTMVSNKAGILMRDPHRIGFEIVDKNDTNTKILAIWAFRLNPQDPKSLVYAPCFFIGGRVIAEMLYQVSTKKFRALNPDRAQHMVDLVSQSDGQPISKSETGKALVSFHADRLLRTPAVFGKSAALTEALVHVPEMMEEAERQIKCAGVLQDYMRQHGQLDALDTLVKWAKTSQDFGSALMSIPSETWMPSDMQLKRANAVQTHVTVGVYGPNASPATIKAAKFPDMVAQDVAKKGYSFEGCEIDEVPSHFTVVYDGKPPEYRQVAGDGIWSVLDASGKSHRAAVGRTMYSSAITNISAHPSEVVRDINGESMMNCRPCSSLRADPPSGRTKNVRCVILDDKADGVVVNGDGLGLWSISGQEGELAEAGHPAQEMKAGKFYVLISPDFGAITEPIKCIKSSTKDGLTRLTLSNYPGSEDALVINTDSTSIAGYGTINGNWRAVEVPGEVSKPSSNWRFKTFVPGTSDTVMQTLTGSGKNVKKATIERQTAGPDELFTIAIDARHTLPCTRMATMLKLAGMLGVHPEAAEAMLDQSAPTGRAHFLLEFPEKQAGAMLRIIDQPVFEQTVDPIHQVLKEHDKMHVLRTDRTPVYTPPARIGDRYVVPNQGTNQTSLEDAKDVPMQVIMQGSPQQIAEYAAMKQLPHVFDHGVMASLAKTHDAGLFLDQYIPKLEDGIDTMARCLFMYYWKPDDWKRLYGSDDMTEMEDKLLNAFKSMDSVVLDLVRKAHTNNNSATAVGSSGS